MERRTDGHTAVPPLARPAGQVSGLSRAAVPLLRAMRPRQWLKNGLVFMALAFSVGQSWSVNRPESWMPLLAKVTLAFTAFCAASSAEYLINDLRDIERDRLHP
ncbi:MAG: hypothetical protein C4290_05225, partial [Chloroflexota bacterium]